MDLLFKREQTSSNTFRVNFKLWAKVELNDEEKQLISKYKFDGAVLHFDLDINLIKYSIAVGFVGFILTYPLLSILTGISGTYMGWMSSFICQVLLGIAAGYYYFHNKRETIYVKDLIHGRQFKCMSVCELARKEAGLTTITDYFRQVLESAKNWDGGERYQIVPLPKEHAKRVILSGPIY